jgi:gliding motility-associated-like protein
MNGTYYSIGPVAFNFLATQCSTYNYATHPLNCTLSDNAWTGDIDFIYTNRGPVGTAHTLLSATAGTLNSWNVGSSYAMSNQDAIEAYILSPAYGAQNTDSIFGRSKDGIIWNNPSRGIPVLMNTKYYIRLQRLSPVLGKISLFIDSARTQQAPGSPQLFPITCSVQGLTTVQHGSIPQGWWLRQLTGSLDNLYIKNDSSNYLPFTVMQQVQNSFCAISNGSINLFPNGGTAPYYYSWSTGANVNSINNLPAGNYSVQVTDAQGCYKDLNFTILQSNPLTAVFSGQINCNGDTTSVSIFASGTPPYNYSWALFPLAHGNIIHGVGSGLYQVTITDSAGCIKTFSDTLVQPAPISAYATSTWDCNGINSSIATHVSGGTAPFLYTWSTSPLQTSPIAVGLTAGIYSCSITDAHQCKVMIWDTIPVIQPLSITMQVVNPSCNGADNGSIAATISGGISGYTAQEQWNTSPVQTGPTLNNLSAGNYVLTVSVGNCQMTSIALLIDPAPIDSLAISPSFCNDDTLIELSLPQGFASYQWYEGNSAIPGAVYNSYYASTSNLQSYYALWLYKDCRYRTPIKPGKIFQNVAKLKPANIFSPNADGINEIFIPFETGSLNPDSIDQMLTSYEFYIYDRWGKFVFNSRQFSNGWDGRFSNGDRATEGVYFWIVSLSSSCQSSKKVKLSGFVQLQK